jgi:hypothetical protein
MIGQEEKSSEPGIWLRGGGVVEEEVEEAEEV